MNNQKLNHFLLASMIIEQDGIDGMERATLLVRKEIAVAFLVANMRRSLRSANKYPDMPDTEKKVKEFLSKYKLMEINLFRDEYRWLSNFWLKDIRAYGYTFRSNEHGFQAMMTVNEEMRQKIIAMPTALEVKNESLKKDFPLREDWQEVQIEVMRTLVDNKFSIYDSHELAYKMYTTWDLSIKEGNTWEDTFWGECDGVGENNLGELHMEKRSEIVSFIQYILSNKKRFNQMNFENFHERINNFLIDKPVSKESLYKWLQILGVTG